MGKLDRYMRRLRKKFKESRRRFVRHSHEGVDSQFDAVIVHTVSTDKIRKDQAKGGEYRLANCEECRQRWIRLIRK